MNLGAGDLDFPDLPDAACAEAEDPERWFAFDPRLVAQARAVCRRCPVIRDCLAWALTHNEYGVWAATTEDQRAALKTRPSRSPA